MNKKYALIGLVSIIAGVWLYAATSLLKVEETPTSKNLIIKEGLVRKEDEVARKLAHELEFDIEGAYIAGYTPPDVIDLLMKEPHKYPVTFYNGTYYEDRKTLPRIYPLSVSYMFFAIGAVILIFKGRNKKS